MNEAKQILLARQGDENAWVALVRHHQEAVFRFAYLLVGNADDAADVAQEALIRAFRALDRFEPERPLRPWLLQIAKNVAANQRRSVRRYIAAVHRWWQAAPYHTATEQNSVQQETTELLWQAIQRLKTTDQEIIYLRYFLDLSVAETAVVLNIAEGTVKSRLSRALGQLRTVVEHEFPSLREEVGV
ncbi:MAG: RNA polymerase sigma factor [Caldilineaceae bacterium]